MADNITQTSETLAAQLIERFASHWITTIVGIGGAVVALLPYITTLIPSADKGIVTAIGAAITAVLGILAKDK
jgi:drug/metabolite transporter (DMT)-like permease